MREAHSLTKKKIKKLKKKNKFYIFDLKTIQKSFSSI
jgi:hypothetical protein